MFQLHTLHTIRLPYWAAVLMAGMAVAVASTMIAYAMVTTGPSALCHVTDGAFTDCNGTEEWSDIAPSAFDDSGSVLYVDQADLDSSKSIPDGSGLDTLMLMYDEAQRTVPLTLGETVDIHFMTVDELALVHYDVAIGSGGLVSVAINGVTQDPMPSGVAGIAGYGSSPNNATPHVIAEFQIGLEAAGFTGEECCYSPDPAWWGSAIPPDPPQECLDDQRTIDGTQTGDFQIPTEIISLQLTGECKQEPVTTTAGIITANLDGTTTVDPQPLIPAGEEPPLCESIGRIINFRVPPGGTYKNHGDYVRQVAQLAEALVNSQVTAGLITADEAEKLQSCVVNPRARSDVGKSGGNKK